MKRKGILLIFVVILVVIAYMPISLGQETKLLIGTGGMAGVYYPIGGGIASIINEFVPNASATIQATAAGIENIRLMSQNEIDLALVGTSHAYYAFNGVELFKGEKIDNLRGIMVLYPQPVQIVVAADSPYYTFEDLIGTRIGVGAPGSGDEGVFREIMAVAGLTYDDFKANFISFAEQASAFKDRHIDAMFYVAGIPASGIMDVASVRDIRLISIKGDLMNKLLDEYAYYAKTIIPSGTYPKMDSDVETLAMPAYLIGNENLDEKLVYNIVAAVFENLNVLHQSHNQAKQITLETALAGSPILLHPGAEKYYKEKGLIK